jgi:hypothetical protein
MGMGRGGVGGRVRGWVGERARGGVGERVRGWVGERARGGVGERIRGEKANGEAAGE